MTPSHTGLGAVILCTAGGQKVAVDMRYVVGSDRGDRARDPVVDLAARIGVTRPSGRPNRILHVATAAGRLTLGCDHITQPLDTAERIPLPSLLGPAAQAAFESVARIDDAWHLVLDVGALFGLARPEAPAPEPAADGAAPSPRRRRASRGHLLVFTTGVPDAAPVTLSGALAYALGAAQVIEVRAVPEVRPVPLAPVYVRGLCDWRGRPLVVVDLATRLLAGTFHTVAPSRLIVCRGRGRERVGLLSAADVQMVRLPLRHGPTAAALPLDASCTRLVVDVGATTLILPDLQRLGEVAVPGL